MVIERGDIWWVSLGQRNGSEPGYRRPVVVVQSDEFNRSRIGTLIAVVITSNLRLAQAPGNVLLSAKSTGLNKNSVANESQVITVNKSFLTEKVGKLTARQVESISVGLRLVMSL